MAEPTLNFVNCPDKAQGHRMAYWQWGAADAGHVIVCAHGLSRQGRDFDELAQALVERARQPVRIVCPDVAGRGQSEWLQDPMGYQIPNYAADMLALLTQLKPATLDWVGTSMGGLIGIVVCAHAKAVGQTVRRLVLNDVGPVVQWDSIQRIAAYFGKNMQFPSEQVALDSLWAISTGFGPHTPQQWQALCRPMLRPVGDAGELTLHYDPAIAVPMQSLTQESVSQGEAAVWQMYDSIEARTLLLRGAQSDLLSHQTAAQMCQRGPRARLVEFEGVGHAPTLVAPEQVDVVASFLLEP